jgi:hypothetical protein
MLDSTPDELFSIHPGDVEEFRLMAVRRRFDDLRPRVGFLDKLADATGVDHIGTVNDAVPVLFQHSVYKSYPLSVLERNQFGRLTKWLDQLTAIDLTDIDVSGCNEIDEWLDFLDQMSAIRVTHTSATGGKLSFIPRSEAEIAMGVKAWRIYHMGFGNQPGVDIFQQNLPVVAFGYRYGYNSTHRTLETLASLVAGSKDRVIALYPYKMSADLLSLAGRLAAVETGGGANVGVSESLAARREEFQRLQEQRDEDVRRFVDRLKSDVAGAQVYMTGVWPHYLDVALEGERQEVTGLFDPSSPVVVGGGFKARKDIPDDWYERISTFLGVREMRECYGMTEMIAKIRRCEQHHYHVPPYMLPFVLDPDTNEPSPREGVESGRFAFVDLLAETYWGGFITGDEVIAHWDGGCPCGQRGMFLDQHIERYSMKRGGDDKISCARIPEAHDNALDYLLEVLS